MTKSKLQEIMKKNFMVECEVEDAIKFVNDLLYERRCELERDEPYATNTIQRLRNSEEDAWDLLYYVDEIMQEEEE